MSRSRLAAVHPGRSVASHGAPRETISFERPTALDFLKHSKMKNRKTIWFVGALLVAALVGIAFQFAPQIAAFYGLFDLGTGLLLSAALAAPDASELKSTLVGLKSALEKSVGDIAKIPGLEKSFGQIETEVEQMQAEFSKLRKFFASRGMIAGRQPRKGFLSDDAARAFGSQIVLGLARKGAFDTLDDATLRYCNDTFGIETRAALTTTDIALPVEYTAELKELQATYGVARRVMTHYPIGRGTSKPARLGTQDDFVFPIAISAAVSERNVKLGNASLESHKGGGLLRLPREINEQGIIPLGQMLARYAARKFGKIEDQIGFLGDGTATYDSISGVCKIANANGNEVQLGATKTAPSDATLENWRSLRPLCATPILSSGVYFAHATWERRFRTFKTQADPMIYVQNGPGGTATLDGYPIIWTEILAPYSENANANAYIGVFGDLSYWWFGEHGAPRTDFSTDVFFTTDELAVRWLEEIDFDYADPECAAALRLAAA